MFSLHETTKIHLCRIAFVATCLAPTCAVLAWGALVRLPSYTRAHELAIADGLGLHAQLGRASSPRPGMMLYEALELSDPDTLQPLARFPFVEVQASGDVLHVTLPFPAMINGTRLDAFWSAARHSVRPSRSWRELHFTSGNLTIHLPTGDQSFTTLAGRIDNTEEHARLQLNLRRAVSGSQPAEAAQLVLERQWQTQPQATLVQFNTGGTPLPCALVASIWPGVETLGPASEFQGRIVALEQAGRTKTELSGRLVGADLDRLVSGQFPHKLTGRATAELDLLTIDDGRLETAAGKISAGPGTISRSLVRSAQSNLSLQGSKEFHAPGERLIAYAEMNFAFKINREGLSLRGESPTVQGALLVDERRHILLGEPTGLVQPVVNIARTLVPQSQVQVPATRETAALIRALPVPSALPAAEGQEPAAQARRLRVVPKPQ
jgi:hypothetical protein